MLFFQTFALLFSCALTLWLIIYIAIISALYTMDKSPEKSPPVKDRRSPDANMPFFYEGYNGKFKNCKN